jgi:hypothetical protein
MEIQLDSPPSFYSDILAADEWSNKRSCLFFYTCETGSPVQNVYYSVKRSNNNAGSTICFMWRSGLQPLKNEKLRRSAACPPVVLGLCERSLSLKWTQTIQLYFILGVSFSASCYSKSNSPSLCILYNQRDANYTTFFIIINALHVSGEIPPIIRSL